MRILRPEQIQLIALGLPPIPANGGGGSSSSSSSTTTQNIDRRQVVDNGSVGVTSDASSVTVNVLDQGAVAAAFDLVKNSDQITGESVGQVLGFAKDIFGAGVQVLDRAGKQVESQGALIRTAYDDAKGEGTQKNMIAAAALATVAIVAVKVWGK